MFDFGKPSYIDFFTRSECAVYMQRPGWPRHAKRKGRGNIAWLASCDKRKGAR
jgi:hypothetical protein